jgi:hypothetical protein
LLFPRNAQPFSDRRKHNANFLPVPSVEEVNDSEDDPTCTVVKDSELCPKHDRVEKAPDGKQKPPDVFVEILPHNMSYSTAIPIDKVDESTFAAGVYDYIETVSTFKVDIGLSC